MKVIYTKTGSTGNCSVIEGASGDLLVIDCGIQFKKVNKELGFRLQKAKAVIVSHDHADHLGYAKTFCEAGMTCYGLRETLSKVDRSVSKRYIKDVECNRMLDVDGFKIVPFMLKHTNTDGTDCPCCGYLIQDKVSKEKMIWATDTQYISQKFPKLSYIAIECNHFEKQDFSSFEDSSEMQLEKRRMQSHMSFETAEKFLKMQDLSECKGVYLLHLSHSLTEKQREHIRRKMQKSINKEGVTFYA